MTITLQIKAAVTHSNTTGILPSPNGANDTYGAALFDDRLGGISRYCRLKLARHQDS
jgi:hypothetical protein